MYSSFVCTERCTWIPSTPVQPRLHPAGVPSQQRLPTGVEAHLLQCLILQGRAGMRGVLPGRWSPLLYTHWHHC